MKLFKSKTSSKLIEYQVLKGIERGAIKAKIDRDAPIKGTAICSYCKETILADDRECPYCHKRIY